MTASRVGRPLQRGHIIHAPLLPRVNTSTSSSSAALRLARRLLVPSLAVAMLLGLAQLRLPGADGLAAQYLDGPATAGRVMHATVDRTQTTDTVRSRWNGTGPEAFTVVWTGYLTVQTPGMFTFGLSSDDGSMLFVDEQVLVDNGGRHTLDTKTGVRRLTSGPHAVRIAFTNANGDYAFSWWWARQGDSPSSVPSWLLSTTPVRYPQALAARVVSLLFPVCAVVAMLAAFVVSRARLREWNAASTLRHRLVAWSLPALPASTARAGALAARMVAVLAPIALLAHAFAFWGRGVIDQEAVSFVINYLADRPFLHTIFDPLLNDWGLYQARELAYVFDWMDARLFAWLLVDRHMLLFVPFSSVLALSALSAIYLLGARRVLRLDWTTALLLYGVFLSTIVVQSSTAILYRSSKVVLAALQTLFFMRALALLEPERRRTSAVDVGGLAVVGMVMAWVDRQGYALSLVVATVAGFLWVRQQWLPQPEGRVRRAYGAVTIAAAIATLWAIAYNNVIAPNVIHSLNGYWPDFVFEEIPLVRLDAQLVIDTLHMFARQIELFFGHLPFVGVCALALLVWGAAWVHDDRRAAGMGFWGWLTGTGVVITTAMIGASIILIAVAGMRHPPVFRISDHALWYYMLPFQATVLFASSLAVSRLPSAPSARWPGYAWIVLVLMIAGNAWHWSAEREFIATSPQYFGKQHEFSRLYTAQFDLDEAGASEQTRVLPSWMRVRPDAAEVHLPLRDYGFLDAVRASYLTVQHRAPLVDAGGPHWKELREFLDGGASPMAEAGQVADTLAALQSVGIRRLVIHRAQLETPAAADAVVDAARSLGKRVKDVRTEGPNVVVSLGDVRFPRVNTSSWREVPPASMRLSASHEAGALPGAVDRSRGTEWNSNVRQTGTEWIRIDFDRPRTLAGVQLDITSEAMVRYPRRLRVEAVTSVGTQTVFEGSVLPSLLRGVLVDPPTTAVVLPVDLADVQAVVLRQTGESPSWGWAVRELRVFEQR